MRNYNINDWYWIIGNNKNNVFSSDRSIIVPITDTTYTTWLTSGNLPTKIDSWSSLYGVMLNGNMTAATYIATTQQTSLTPLQIATFLLNGTVSIISSSNGDLNGTYDISANSQSRITSITTGINAGKGLPGGNSTFGYADVNGAVHIFTVNTFVDFASAIENYVYDVYSVEATLLANGKASWPSSSLTIA